MKTTLLPIIIATAIPSTSFANLLVLDDFMNTPSSSVTRFSGGDSGSFTLTNTGSIGGSRMVRYKNNYTPGGSDTSLIFLNSTFTSPDSGREIAAALNLPTGGAVTDEVDVEFTYSANGLGLSADLTTYSQIDLLWEGDHRGHSNGSSIALVLEDSANRTHTETFSYAAGFPGDDDFVETLSWNLSDFSNQGLNLSDIDEIKLVINTDADADWSFSSLTAVPEPSSVLVITLSCGAFLFRRKR